MKRLLVILLSVLLLACGKRSEPIAEQMTPFSFDENLLRIDSLMQHNADTALLKLLSFRAERETSITFNANYQSLLISEALYKTDNPQLNRYGNETFQETSLHDAVHYFDSLIAAYPASDDLAMLSARSHYMNGVGYYESDSIVDACKEYLKTLEIMEGRFDEKDMTGYKAKFMGLTHNRLKELFASQFMIEQAIYCEKKSVFFSILGHTSLYEVSNNLAKLGQLYDIAGQTDSAYYYYNEALNSLPDTNNLIYRDLASSLAMLSYEMGNGFSTTLEQLMLVAQNAESYDELLTRYFTIGGLYYEEALYDSAVAYLDLVYEHELDNVKKLQSASFLMYIFQMANDTIKASYYSNYIAHNAVAKYDKPLDASVLNDMFQDYLRKKAHELQKRNNTRITILISCFAILTIVLVVFILTYSTKKIDTLNKEHRRLIDTERKARYREKSKMLDTIKQQETKVDILEQELGQKRHEANLSLEALLNEPVCKNIQDSVSNISVTSRVNYADYHYLKLDETACVDLDRVVSKHFPNFKKRLYSNNYQIKRDEMLICYLYLLGLKDQHISVLMRYHYSTVYRKVKKMEKALNIDVTLSEYVQKTAVL